MGQVKVIRETRQFRKDLKRLKKQGLPFERLKAVGAVLADGGTLDPRHRDHALAGAWSGSRDCHVGPDWILIYRVKGDVLFLERTGSHSEMFKK